MHQIGQLDQFKNKNWGEKYTSIYIQEQQILVYKLHIDSLLNYPYIFYL